jgi:hypothetical protein
MSILSLSGEGRKGGGGGTREEKFIIFFLFGTGPEVMFYLGFL